jgi:hypothetical protein
MTFMIIQFLVFVSILKNRFCKSNPRLSALVVHEIEVENLVSFFFFNSESYK